MKKLLLFTAIALCTGCAAISASAEEGTVTPLFSTELPDYPGKEALMINVDYAPGGSTPIHKHDAHAFVYLLEGSIVMQVEGQEAKTLLPGDTYYESPTDIHLVSRNASDSEPARFIVVLLKKKDNPVVMPVD